MAKKHCRDKAPGQHVALILVEGETEEEFYASFAAKYFRSKPKHIKNLKGNFNVNTKIADAILQYHQNNPTNTFDVYVCIDQERIGVPAYNKELISTRFSSLDKMKKNRLGGCDFNDRIHLLY